MSAQRTQVPLAGISDRFRIHDLRHPAAALMIQAGYRPKMLQEILGHATMTTTLDLYGHLYPATWISTPTAWMPPPRTPRVRPKQDQMTMRTTAT